MLIFGPRKLGWRPTAGTERSSVLRDSRREWLGRPAVSSAFVSFALWWNFGDVFRGVFDFDLYLLYEIVSQVSAYIWVNCCVWGVWFLPVPVGTRGVCALKWVDGDLTVVRKKLFARSLKGIAEFSIDTRDFD